MHCTDSSLLRGLTAPSCLTLVSWLMWPRFGIFSDRSSVYQIIKCNASFLSYSAFYEVCFLRIHHPSSTSAYDDINWRLATDEALTTGVVTGSNRCRLLMLSVNNFLRHSCLSENLLYFLFVSLIYVLPLHRTESDWFGILRALWSKQFSNTYYLQSQSINQ